MKKVFIPLLAIVLALGLALPTATPVMASPSTLTVEFPGISSVHVYVRVDDGNVGTATGTLVASTTYQTNSATFVLLTNIYDVVVVKPGPMTEILDSVLVISLDIKPGYTMPLFGQISRRAHSQR